MIDDKLVHFIKEKGGAQYHIIWAKYFTLPPYVSDLSTGNSMVDDFLTSFHYLPLTNNRIYDSLKQFNSDESTSHDSKQYFFKFFYKLLDPNSFDIKEIAIFANTMLNQKKQGNIKKNDEQLASEYLFRGLVVLTLKLPELLETNQSDTNWDVFNFFLSYFSSLTNEIYHDFLCCLDPIIEIFKLHNFLGNGALFDIFSVNTLSSYTFFSSVVKVIVSSTNEIIELDLLNIVSNMVLCFSSFISYLANSKYNFSNDDQFIQYYSVFIKMLGYSKSQKLWEMLKKMKFNINIIANFLILFEEFNSENITESDKSLYNNGIDTISLIHFVETDDPPEFLLFGRGLVAFLNWTVKRLNFETLFSDIKKYQAIPETLSYQTEDDYFINHQEIDLHDQHIPQKNKNKNNKYKELGSNIRNMLNSMSYLNCFIQILLLYFENFSSISWIIILSNFPCDKIQFNNENATNLMKIINNFLNLSMFKKETILEKHNAVFYNYILHFIFNLYLEIPESRKPIINQITSLKISSIIRIMPLFRSLLLIDNQINFIIDLLNSNFFSTIAVNAPYNEYKQEFDEIIAFCQICIIKQPQITLASLSFISFLKQFLILDDINPKYQELILNCFKFGLYSSNSPNTQISIYLQIASLLIYSVQNKTSYSLSSAQKLIVLLTQSIIFITQEVAIEIEKQSIFDSISKLPMILKTKESMIMILNFFLQFFEKFPDFTFHFEKGFIYENLKYAFNDIKVDDDILLILFQLLINSSRPLNKNSSTNNIKNIPALRFALDVVNKSEIEIKKKTLDFILKSCINNTVNRYICYQSGILDFLISCIDFDELLNVALQLYKIIASLFFGLRDLRYSSQVAIKNSKNCELILNQFLEMIKETSFDKVTSFFHFSGLAFGKQKKECILSSISDPQCFSNTFSISTLISLSPSESNDKAHRTLLMIRYNKSSKSRLIKSKHSNKVYSHINIPIDIFFNLKTNLCICDENNFFRYNFRESHWYSIAIVFTDKSKALLYVNQQFIEEITLKTLKQFKHDISKQKIDNLQIVIGDGFIGDIGDTFIAQNNIANSFSESKQEEETSNLSLTRSSSLPFLNKSSEIKFKNSKIFSLKHAHTENKYFYQFLPRNVDNGIIIDTGARECSIFCQSVPFCSPFKQCIHTSLIMKLILPIFSFIDNSTNLHLLFLFIRMLFKLSPDYETYFEDIGGFRLLVGLIKGNINNFSHLFNETTCNDLLNIFESITHVSLVTQMIEYIMMDFNFISLFNEKFQSKFIQFTLYEAFNLSINNHMIETQYTKSNKSFQYSLLRSILSSDYTIASVCKESAFQSDIFHLYFNVLNKLNDVDSSDEINFENYVDKKAILFLFFNIYQSCNSCILRTNILKFFNLFFNAKKISIFTKIFPIFGCYHPFYVSFCNALSNNENILGEEQREALRFLSYCIQMDKNLKKNIMKIATWIPFDENPTLLSIISYELMKELKCYELIYFICNGFPFASENDRNNINDALQSEIRSNTTVFENFYNNIHSSLFIFIYCFSNFGDPSKDKKDYWNTFVPFFINNIGLLKSLFIILDSFTLFLEVDTRPIKYLVLSDVISYFRKNNNFIPKLEDIQNSIAKISLEVMFFQTLLENNNSPKPFSKAIYELTTLKQFILWLSNSQVDKFYNVSVKLTNDPKFSYSIFQLLSQILFDNASTTSNQSYIKITQDDSYNLFSLICIVISIIIENSKDQIDIDSVYDFFMRFMMQKEQKQINQIYHSLVKAKIDNSKFINEIKFFKDDDSLKNDLIIILEDGLSQFLMENVGIFKKYRMKLSSILHFENKNDNSKYQQIINNSSKKSMINEMYCKSLSLSFIREVNEDFIVSKWKISNEIDNFGRRLYMSPNRYFNNHMKASILRDSTASLLQDQSLNDESNNVISLKKMLEKDAQQKYIKDGSGVALLITLSGWYDVSFSFNLDSISICGEMKYDGNGSRLDEVTKNDSSKEDLQNFKSSKFIEIKFRDVLFIFNRRVRHIDSGCEIFMKNRKSYFLNFPSKEERQSFYSPIKWPDSIPKSKSNPFDFFHELRRVCNSLYQNMPSSELFQKSKISVAWQNRRISNYQYLFYLNLLSGRSFHDISQYPVFPWILKEYGKSEIDLNDPSVYRDLSIPMGAMNEKRLATCRNMMNESFEVYEKCLYRVFYSNPGMVIGFLIRSEPFTTLHIQLQSGKFDFPDRIFNSIEFSFKSASSSVGDFAELIPEFFSNPHFLLNENNFDLGVTQSNQRLNDVILPKWAKSAQHFIDINRQALESEYVRLHLNEWIDLIFGIYQKSLEKNNLFHLFCYNDCMIDPDIINEGLTFLAQRHAQDFGSSPDKILMSPHPSILPSLPKPIKTKMTNNLPKEDILFFDGYFLTVKGDFGKIGSASLLNVISLFPRGVVVSKFNEIKSDNNVIEIEEKTLNLLSCSKIFLRKKKLFIYLQANGSYATIINLHDMTPKESNITLMHKSSPISCIYNLNEKYIVTGGSDCCLNLWAIKDFSLYTSIPFISEKIVSISGDINLDRIVAIDSHHQVFIISISKKSLLFTFNLFQKDDSNLDQSLASRHSILLLDNGKIVISCEKSVNSTAEIFIFDLIGNQILHNEDPYIFNGEIVKMFSMKKENQTFLVLSMTTKRFVLINLTKLDEIKPFNVVISPDLICLTNHKNSLLISNKQRELKIIDI